MRAAQRATKRYLDGGVGPASRALAVPTERLRLRSIVGCVYYRGPALPARHADVDRLRYGRLVLRLGFGDNEAVFQVAQYRVGAVAGTPADLIAYYRALVGLGIRCFIAAIFADDTGSYELFAHQVMPEFA